MFMDAENFLNNDNDRQQAIGVLRTSMIRRHVLS
jgi:hypothetical protein